MRSSIRHCAVMAALAGAIGLGAAPAAAQLAPSEGLATGRSSAPVIDPKAELRLNDQQRALIRQSVTKERAKVKPPTVEVNPKVGADLPPSLELYYLPDPVIAEVPNAKLYRYTMIRDEVILVDPTKMRVIEVIR